MKRKKVSGKELARRMKVDVRNVRRWLNTASNPRFYTLVDMAKALGCKVRDLIKED